MRLTNRSILVALFVALVCAPLLGVQATNAPSMVGSEAAQGPVPALQAPGAADATARQIVAQLPRATWINDPDGDKVFDTLEEQYLRLPPTTSGEPATLPTVTLFRHDVPPTEGLAAVRALEPDVTPTHVFSILPGFAAHLDHTQAASIAALPEVRQVQWSPEGTPELETARHYSGVEAVRATYGEDGDRDGDPGNFSAADVTILISDTGFDSEHVDLPPSKFLAFLDVGENVTDAPYDGGSHGTHVASIASGLGIADERYRGVAPGAALVGSKITGSCSGGLPVLGIGATCPSAHTLAIETLDWAVANKDHYGIDITTISFGFGIATDGTDALELAMDKAWDAGIINFKSTGNSGPNPGTLTVPAAARGIIATGAMQDPGGSVDDPDRGFSLASFSSRGPTEDGRIKPDIAAPGVSIMAASAGTTDEYVAFSGTSMASPFAAGTAALVLDANPGLTPDEVRQVLFESARDWSFEGPDNEYGNGRLDALRAVELARYLADADFRRSAVGPELPSHQHFEIQLDINGAGLASFEVEDATQPLTGTIIGHETPTDGTLWLVNAQIVGPEGQRIDVEHLSTLLRTPSRQVTLAITPTADGTHELQVLGEPNTRLGVDVSAGVEGTPLLELVPDTSVGIEGADIDAEAPGLTATVLIIGVLMGALAIARQRRP